MENKFKPGDKVKCINNFGIKNILEVGKVYTIENCGHDHSTFVYIQEINRNLFIERFILATKTELVVYGK